MEVGSFMIKQTISTNGRCADFFVPEGGARRKTIIMLGGSEGGKSWSRVRQVLTRLTGLGYNLLSSAYFKAPGLPETLQEIPLEGIEQWFAWLGGHPAVIPDEYAVIGGSKGAELGLLLASRYPQIRAVVAISPSSVVWQGIPRSRFQLAEDVRSSWSYLGSELPYVAYPVNGADRASLLTLRLRKIHERALESIHYSSDAVIPVEQARGPVMLVSGQKDQMWPSEEMSEQIMARLTEMEFPHPYQHMSCSSGHNGLIMNREMWRQVFTFLRQYFPAS